jgi:hypothetical protein
VKTGFKACLSNSNLYRYGVDPASGVAVVKPARGGSSIGVNVVGLYARCMHLTHSLKAAWFQPSRAYEVKTWFQSLLSNGSTGTATPWCAARTEPPSARPSSSTRWDCTAVEFS